MKASDIIILTVILLMPFIQTFAQTNGDYIYPSSGIKYQFIGKYDIERLNKILTTELAEFSDFKTEYPQAKFSVNLYRVIYSSVIPEQNNKPTIASGLIAIPETGNNNMPVVSYQHGTVFTKTAVPSFPEESMETRLEIAQFAGQGYIVIAADYFGKGLSAETDSYLVKASTQQACLDMLFAAKYITASLNINTGHLFLSGWSQGGWCTLVFLNKLESLGIPVKAAAIASAPTDIFAIINRWIHAPKDIDAVFLPGLMALQSNAYEEYYRVPGLVLSSIKPEYQQISRDLYLNNITWEEFSKKTPGKINDFLQSSFIAASSAGDNLYCQILQQSQAYRWRSVTPLHTYYGDIDEVVPEYIATLPAGYQQIMGGAKVTSVASGSKANHRGNFVYAVAHQKKWFDEYLEK